MTLAAIHADPWVTILMGKSLGPYVLTEHISAGGFGHVFEAQHSDTNAAFALKVMKLNPTPEASIDFVNEAMLLRQLSACDGIINYVDDGIGRVEMQMAGGLVIPIDVRYIVLARASGSVDELILDPIARGDLSIIEKLRLWRDVIKAVRQMHGMGIVHRDLKCSNCLLMVRGNYSTVKIADLGRSKDLSQPLTKLAEEYVLGRGDLRYAPPEYLYLQGEPSSTEAIAADYYGLGSILVELITGQSMTSLALGDFQHVISQARTDYQEGRSRDLSVLVGRYRAVISDIVEELPACIRADVSMLLSQVCHPVPGARSRPSPFRRDRLDKDSLHWIVRRVDIMIKQLEIEVRMKRRANQTERRSA